MSVSAWIGTISLTLVVSIGGFIAVRDKIVEAGVDRPRWLTAFLERTSRRAAARRLMRDIGTMHTPLYERLGNVVEVEAAQKTLPQEVAARPDVALAEAIKPWIIALERTDFRGLHHYVDTMGAVRFTEDSERTFAEIAHAWIAVLQARNELLGPIDCILGLKEGNPLLVHALARRLTRATGSHVQAILCKGAHDPARVTNGPHETDFEGLRAFRGSEEQSRHPDGRYRTIVVDDNCTSGRTMLEAVSRFNAFVRSRPDYSFAPIEQAVVLFVVKSPQGNVVEAWPDMTLHALLALADDDMAWICRTSPPELKRDLHRMKDHPACTASRQLSG